jgi:dipeptidase E
MKLYISSYKLGNKKEELKKWLETNDNKIGLIINSRDVFPDGERKTFGIKSDADELIALGFDVEIVDLKDYFNNNENTKELFNRLKAFYAIGGNTFVLRKAMQLSGFDKLLIDNAYNPEYLYAGYSAGVCLLSKSLRGVAVMDEPELDPYKTNQPPIYDGLGLIDEMIIPHFNSNHKETELASKAVEYCKQNNFSYIAMQDGDVMIKDITKNNTLKL